MKKILLFALLGFLILPSTQTYAREENEVDDSNKRRGLGLQDQPIRPLFGDSMGIGETRRGEAQQIERIRIGGDDERGLSKKAIIERRFDWALSALNTIYAKLGNVITRLDEGGIDVTQAETDLAIAKTKIDTATSAVKELKDFVATVRNASTNPSGTTTPAISESDKTKIRELAKKAKEAIQEAHKSLKTVHQDIKQAIEDARGDSDDDSDNDSSDDSNDNQ